MADKKAAKPRTKSEIFAELAERTKLTKKQIAEVFEALTDLIHQDVKKKDLGIFTLPGLLKIKRVERKARPARMGRNPATGEEMMIKAKPASKTVKAFPLKSLKDSV
jgi:nucleoid DNA-binding protein